MFSKQTLEALFSFFEFWGVALALIGATFLFLSVIVNHPLKKMVEAEIVEEKRANEQIRLKFQTEIADANARGEQAILGQKHLEAEAAKASEKTAELRAQNLATEALLERERMARLEMEAAVSPRILKRPKDAGLILTPFSGMTYDLEFLFESEATRTAAQIADMLDIAGWKVAKMLRPINDVFLENHDGVTIEFDTDGTDSANAAKSLAKTLSDQGIQAVSHVADSPLNKPHCVRIRVGLKPTEYFTDKHRQELPQTHKATRSSE